MSTLAVVSTSAILNNTQEDASFDQGTVTNGHGSCSGVYVTVQKGTSADVDIDFTIDTLSEDSFNQFVKHVQTTDYQKYANTSEANFATAGSWFCSLFGGVYAGGADITNRTTNFHATTDDETDISKTAYNLNTSKFRVTGKLTAVGTSFIPVTVSAYVQVTKIKFSDGKELHVINTDSATAASSSGDTQGAQTQSGKLSVTPL